MKTLIASLAALAAVAAAAAPAAAQSYGQDRHEQPSYEQGRYEQGRYEQGRYEQGRYEQDRHEQGRDWNGNRRVSINERQQSLERRIDHGIRNGDLSRREAYRLRGDSRQIAQLESRYRVNGLSPWERSDLDRRMDRLESQIRAERHDHDNRRD